MTCHHITIFARLVEPELQHGPCASPSPEHEANSPLLRGEWTFMVFQSYPTHRTTPHLLVLVVAPADLDTIKQP